MLIIFGSASTEAFLRLALSQKRHLIDYMYESQYCPAQLAFDVFCRALHGVKSHVIMSLARMACERGALGVTSIIGFKRRAFNLE